MSAESESLTLRMRTENTAAMDAMMAQLAAMRRMYADMEGVHGRLDRIQANVATFQAETGKALRQIQGDVITLENQNIARHGEVLNILRRVDDVEDVTEHLERRLKRL